MRDVITQASNAPIKGKRSTKISRKDTRAIRVSSCDFVDRVSVKPCSKTKQEIADSYHRYGLAGM
jgi:glycerol-3-phosphate cytidylyltransferase-like family protein